ncbi:hypothetical protein KC921_05495 [Candidatus Woesebacteria bacterium]|nr:hypothetical protein [Candidatus Woesebacteria bacterium]
MKPEMSGYLSLVQRFLVLEQPDPKDVLSFISESARFLPVEYEKLAGAPPAKIVVVCRENQGRSQIAEALLQATATMIGLPVTIKSVGLHATPEKYDGAPNPIVQYIMDVFGIPLVTATVKQIQPEDITEDTIVIILDDSELPDYIFLAKLVLVNHTNDPSLRARDNDDLLAGLSTTLEELIYFAISLTFKLAETTAESDFAIFENYFHKLVRKKNRVAENENPNNI